MKALILAGGKGTRLRPITFSMAKQLVPIANKPVIEYGIESVVEAGARECGIIVADTASEIQAVCGDGSRWGIEITYIPQPDPLGLAHAVATAHPFLGDDDFIMYLGDNLIKSSIRDLVDDFNQTRPAASILLTHVPNPSDFGVAVMEGDRVVHLDEKPKQPKSNLALVGVYLFTRQIHDAIAQLKPSGRGEYEITEAIQTLIDQGSTVRSHIVTGYWKDTGTVEAMLDANRLILSDLSPSIPRDRVDIDAQSRIEGAVSVGVGTRIERSIIRGPVIIGDNCHISDAYIGPFTAVDHDSTVVQTEIEHSIVLADCVLDQVPGRIESSLLGRGARVARKSSGPKTLSLVLGDSSAIHLP